jgi:hypothetical protein
MVSNRDSRGLHVMRVTQVYKGIHEVLLPADTEQLADEDRANFTKLAGLLVVFLVGCGCWAFAWHRNLANRRIEYTPAATVLQQAQQDTVRSDRR